MLGLNTLRRRAIRWRDRLMLGRPAVVLLYHRVTRLESDPQSLAVSPEHFNQQMAVLREFARPLALSSLESHLELGTLPAGSVAVTFDDGYADNLHEAAPILQRHDIPATVFVASGRLDTDREFWWDELERLLLLPGTLPRQIKLPVACIEADLGDAANYPRAEWSLHRTWTVLRADDPTPRHTLYRKLCWRMRDLSPCNQAVTLNALAALAGATCAGRASHRAMTGDECRQLAESGVEIGAHTVTHAELASLPPEAQRGEILDSKSALERLLGRPVTTFSYPFGSRSSYTPQTVESVWRAGFTTACSNFPGVARQGVSPFELPRFLVRDWDGDTFHRQLREWFDA